MSPGADLWKWLVAAAASLIIFRVLPAPEAAGLVRRVAPILVFLAAITVVAELAEASGVFAAAAAAAARMARGSVPRLFLLVAVLASAVTVVLTWVPPRCSSPRWCSR